MLYWRSFKFYHLLCRNSSDALLYVILYFLKVTSPQKKYDIKLPPLTRLLWLPQQRTLASFSTGILLLLILSLLQMTFLLPTSSFGCQVYFLTCSIHPSYLLLLESQTLGLHFQKNVLYAFRDEKCDRKFQVLGRLTWFGVKCIFSQAHSYYDSCSWITCWENGRGSRCFIWDSECPWVQ